MKIAIFEKTVKGQITDNCEMELILKNRDGSIVVTRPRVQDEVLIFSPECRGGMGFVEIEEIQMLTIVYK